MVKHELLNRNYKCSIRFENFRDKVHIQQSHPLQHADKKSIDKCSPYKESI